MPYIDFARFPEDRKNEYYGNYLYGERLQEYEPAAADSMGSGTE